MMGKKWNGSWRGFWGQIFFVVYSRERECERVSRGRDKERERIPSRLHAISAEPYVELKPTNCKIIS